MKILILVFSLVVSLSAFASQEVYDSLNVEEQVLPSSRMEIIYLKAAGGLSCTKTKYFEEEATYECLADMDRFDSAMIYSSLNVEEVLIPSSRLTVKHTKRIGSLSCVKTSSLVEEISYNCSIRF